MALNNIEWQSLPLVAEWHLNNKSQLVIKQSLIALSFFAIQGAARMSLNASEIWRLYQQFLIFNSSFLIYITIFAV